MEGYFQEYLNIYLKRNKKKLIVLSSFRDPIERHMSSFFQCYGTKALRNGEAKTKFETILYTKSIFELQQQFLQELNDKSCAGMMNESIIDITKELKISFKDLNYNKVDQFGIYESDTIKLYVFHFPFLTQNMSDILSKITGKKIVIRDANMSEDKWYKEIYKEFKKSLYIPKETIINVYSYKKDLVEIFNTSTYELAVKSSLNKYSKR